MNDFFDDGDDMTPLPDTDAYDDTSVEALLSGAATDPDPRLAQLLLQARALGSAPAPAPSAALAAMLTGPSAVVLGRGRRWGRRVATVGVLSVGASGLVVGAAAANVLPRQAQHAVARVVDDITPLRLPGFARHTTGRPPAAPAKPAHPTPPSRARVHPVPTDRPVTPTTLPTSAGGTPTSTPTPPRPTPTPGSPAVHRSPEPQGQGRPTELPGKGRKTTPPGQQKHATPQPKPTRGRAAGSSSGHPGSGGTSGGGTSGGGKADSGGQGKGGGQQSGQSTDGHPTGKPAPRG